MNFAQVSRGTRALCCRDARSGELGPRSLPGADFLWLLLAHVLPRGFRRSRNYGLLHHRRKSLLRRVQLMLRVVIPPAERKRPPTPPSGAAADVLNLSG